MLVIGVFLLLLLGRIEARLATSQQGCSGYIFLAEQSVLINDKFAIAMQAAIDTVEYLADGNGFALRAFGSDENWILLNYIDRYSFVSLAEAWITECSNGVCDIPQAANYTNPFNDILQHLNYGYFGYGIFMMGETDSIVDLSSAMPLAQQIATYDADIYVWDISVNNNDNNLFETLTGGKPGHILRGANLTYNDVLTYLVSTMIPEFMSFSCDPMPVTPTPPPNCSLLAFMEESTVSIDSNTELNFLKLVQRLVNNVTFDPHQQFSISFFGEAVYKLVEPQFLSDFNATLSMFIQDISSGNYINGQRTYLAPMLNEYIWSVNAGFHNNFSALLFAETEAIRDPTNAYSACQTIASLGTDFYVIDQSQHAGPSSLFPTCTGNKPGHVLNGTSLSQDELFNQLRDSLIQNFISMGCSPISN